MELRADARHQSALSQISTRTVQLLKEHYGRGPDKAKTYYQDDLVVVLMRGGFTKAEETLLDKGRGDAVIAQRMAFQEVMRPRFAEVIEEELGRRVVGFMSGNHQHPDLIAEIFIVEGGDLFEPESPADPDG